MINLLRSALKTTFSVILILSVFLSGKTFGQTLVSENFEAVTFPPTGWLVVNAGSGNNWIRSTGTSPAQFAGSTAYMLYPFSSSFAANTWAFTPTMSLTSGAQYFMEFQQAVASASFPENLKVTIGNAQTVASQTTTLLNLPGLVNTTYIKRTVSFTVASSGNYNVAFNCYSALDQFNLAVDNIAIRVAVIPDAPPINFTATAVTPSSMTIGWTDNSTNETAFRLYRSTDNVNFTQIGADIASTSTGTTGTTYSSPQTGLISSTTYFYRIAAVADAESAYLTGSQATAACSGGLSGVVPIGPGQTYVTLSGASGVLAALTANGLAGAVTLELQSNYVSSGETLPITLGTYPCLGTTNTLTIRPALGATALSISGSNATAIIDINGGNNITIDGRPGGTGVTKQLTISNTNTSGATVRFINEAANNTVKYCTVQGAETSTTNGVLFFSTTTGAGGNDNNTIDNCDIKDAGPTPTNGIYASGTSISSPQNNSGNTISNCNIFNFYNSTGSSQGINITSTGNTDWTISGNSFYQTAPRTGVSSSTVTAILLGGGNNYLVTGNFIGGGSANCGAPTWGITGAAASYLFVGIKLTVGTATPSSVQNNTVTNFAWSSSSGTTTLPGVWCGIHLSSGNANIGTVTGNTIGSGTGTGSVLVTSSTTGAISFGIGSSTSSTNTVGISNNTIGSITVLGSTTSVSHSFVGIQITSALSGSIFAVNGNTIGSSTTGNSINSVTASVSTTGQKVSGIENSSSATIAIANNTIANLNSANAANGSSTFASQIRGIVTSGGIGTVTGNTVRNLTNSSTSISTTSLASVIGISVNLFTSGQTVSQNTIHTLSNTAAAAVSVTGLYYSGTTGTNTVARNFIHSLTASNTGAVINGLVVNGGTSTFQNNMIRLGVDAAGSSVATALSINGISETSGTDNFYFNSVYIGGSGIGTTASNSFAFNSIVTTNTRNYQDNIFVNARSNATTGGKHYAVKVGGTTTAPTGLTMTNNVYLVTGTGGVFGSYNGSDVTSLADWKTTPLIAGKGPGLDPGSISADPQFATPNGTSATVDLHISIVNPTPIEGAGILIASVTDDFDGQTRSGLTPVDIGADAGNFVGVDLSAPAISYTPLTFTCSSSDRTLTATITDASGVPAQGSGTEPRIYYKKNAGSYFSQAGTLSSGTVLSGTWSFTIVVADMGGVTAGDVISYYVVAQDVATPTPNISSSPAGVTTGTVNSHTAPVSPNTYIISTTLSGLYSVGTGSLGGEAGHFATLTAAIAAYNTSCLGGAVTFGLTNAAYAEAVPYTINANASASGTNTLTIKPTVSSTTITGSSATAIFVLNGADFVTINGSTGITANTICPSSSASRDLTITNSNTGTTSAVVWLQTNVADGATDNSVKNCNLVGSGSAQTLFGVGSGSSTIGAASLGTGNNNNSIVNNNISKTQYGIYSQGLSAANKNTGNTINQNLINSASPNQVGKAGILTGFENNLTISGNNISNISGTTGYAWGISMGLTSTFTTATTGNEVTNATVTKNIIGTVRAASTFGIAGISVASATSGTTLIANNMISDVNSNGTLGDIAAGIYIGGGTGSTTNVYYNSITMAGTFTGASYGSFAIAVNGSNPVVDIRNNILTSTGSTGSNLNRAIGLAYSTFTNLTSNNNDLFVSGTGSAIGQTGTLSNTGFTAHTTLANWQTSTGKDGLSLNFAPVFTSLSDLHIVAANPTNDPLNNGAVTVSVTDDIDCEIRSTDIGADEFVPPVILDIGAFALISPVTGTGCYTGSENVIVQIKNFGTVAWDFTANNVTVSASVSGTATQSYSVQITSNTLNGGSPLAAGGTLNINMGTLDMRTPGNYTFNASTTVTTGGPDANASNDAIAPVVKTGNNPSVTLTPSATPVCEGTGYNLVANAANGTTTSNQTFSGSNPASAAITDGSLTGASTTIALAATGTISASSTIQVTTNISHGFDADVDIYLVGPANCGAIELSTDNGSSGINYTGTIFNTSLASPLITAGTAPFTGSFKPEGSITSAPTSGSAEFGANYTSVPLIALNGCPVNGSWKIVVGDDDASFIDAGTLNNWSLSITNPAPANYTYNLTGPGTIGSPAFSGANNSTATYGVTNAPTGTNNYSVTVTDGASCTSKPGTTSVFVKSASSPTSFNVTECDSYTLPWGGSVNTSGAYNHTYTNAVGCDSVVTANVIINYTSTPTSFSVTECDSYTLPWGGSATATGPYGHTYTNADGCDSVVTAHVTINNSSTPTSFNVTECDSYTLPWGGSATATGPYSHTYTNAIGCDSVVTAHVTINNSSSPTSFNVTECDSYTLPWGGSVNTTGPYGHTYTNASGCDSVVTAHVIINYTSTPTSFNVTECDSYTLPWGGSATATGPYSHTYTNADGCDSVVTAHVTINNSSTPTSFNVTECDSYTLPWGGSATVTGPYSHTYTNAIGCDSVVTAHVTINYSTPTSFSATACNSYTLPWGGSVTTSGAYNHTYTNASGCDSVVTANVTINYSPGASITPSGITTICKNIPVTFNANIGGGFTYQWYKNGVAIPFATNSSYTTGPDEAGNFKVVVTNSFFCSSTSNTAKVVRKATPTAVITVVSPLNNPDLCVNGHVKLRGNGSTEVSLGYQWKLNGNNIASATNRGYNATIAGSYTLLVTNVSTGCTKLSAPVNVTHACKGDEDMIAAGSVLNMYPNPTDGRFVVDLNLNSALNGNAMMQLFNEIGQSVYGKMVPVVDGKLVEEVQLGENNAAGMYFIQVVINDQVFKGQVIYQK